MPFTKLDRDMLALLKRSMRTIWPTLGSSHADEAIAAYYGFRTYAALLAALPEKPGIIQAEPQPAALFDRLEQLGYRFTARDLDRIWRLTESELIARIGENFRRMAAETANDNRP